METLDLAYWKGTLVNFLNADVQTKFTKKMIRHARRRISQIEAKLLVKVLCCLMILPLVGCSKETNAAIGNFIGSGGKVISAGMQDVGSGIASIGEPRNDE